MAAASRTEIPGGVVEQEIVTVAAKVVKVDLKNRVVTLRVNANPQEAGAREVLARLAANKNDPLAVAAREAIKAADRR